MDSETWPQSGDVFYWARSDTGDICEGMWIDQSPSCQFRKSIGNVFRSRADAKEAIARQQAKETDRKIAEK